jgi:hypothetical protein
MLKPIDLVGHVSLNLRVNGTTDMKDIIPVRPILPFQRTRDAKLRDTHEVTIMLPAVRSVSRVGSSMPRNRSCSKITLSLSTVEMRKWRVRYPQRMPGWKSWKQK